MALMTETSWLGTEAAAAALGCNPETLRRWRRKGQLTEGEHWRHPQLGNTNFVVWNVDALKKLLKSEGY